MTAIIGILVVAALFMAAAFLRDPERCGDECAGCALTCKRGTAAERDATRRPDVRGRPPGGV